MEKVWSVQEILQWTRQKFMEKGFPSPLLDAQLLLCHVMNFTKIQLYTECNKPLSDIEREKMRSVVKRRLKGEPVAYILEEKDWHDFTLKVNKNVLIPRPETETLLDIALQHTPENPKTIIDFCTGSGCLAIALKKAYPEAKVVAVDISPEALEVAKENAKLNSVEIDFICADVTLEQLFQNLKETYGSFDTVVSNPPYVTYDEWENLDTGVKDFEPKLALVAEKDGLAVIEKMLGYLFNHTLFSENSFLAVELAENHPQKLIQMQNFGIESDIKFENWRILAADFPVQTWVSLDDLSGKHRFLSLRNSKTN